MTTEQDIIITCIINMHLLSAYLTSIEASIDCDWAVLSEIVPEEEARTCTLRITRRAL